MITHKSQVGTWTAPLEPAVQSSSSGRISHSGLPRAVLMSAGEHKRYASFFWVTVIGQGDNSPLCQLNDRGYAKPQGPPSRKGLERSLTSSWFVWLLRQREAPWSELITLQAENKVTVGMKRSRTSRPAYVVRTGDYPIPKESGCCFHTPQYLTYLFLIYSRNNKKM